jgi:hypothetical protein
MPLEILSATYTENVENYVFVEAFRKNSVMEAIQGLSLFLTKVEILSLNEMPKIYECNSSAHLSLPKPGSWIRIEGGVYDKDVAIVEKIISDDKVYAKLIPRLEITSK